MFTAPNSIWKPKFIAHRGYTPGAPENSIPAFEAAGIKQYWAIETDVHKTSDGVLVCNHDHTIDAMYDGVGTISEMTYEQIMSYTINKGNHLENYTSEQLKMPTFEQYLQICRYYGSIAFLELKANVVQEVIALLNEYGMADYAVISTSKLNWLQEVRAYSRTIFVHHIFSDMDTAIAVASLGHAGVALNYHDMTLVSDIDVKRLHALGLKVCFRAGDTEQAVKDMISKGVDYIPTNKMYSLRE